MVDAKVWRGCGPDRCWSTWRAGGVVDEKALYEALTEGDTRGRCSARRPRDTRAKVRCPAFAELPNVVLTPHIGAMALDSQRLIGERVIELIEAFQWDVSTRRYSTVSIVV